jgi:hypothetical protein
MIGNSRVKELVGEIRKGSVRIDLDEIRIWGPTGEMDAVPFPFMIEVENGEMTCRWRVQPDQEIPAVLQALLLPKKHSVATAADHYRIEAKTETGLKVQLNYVSPFPSRTSYGDGSSIWSTDVNHVDLVASDLETLNSAQIFARLTSSTVPAEAVPGHQPSERLFAIIPGVPIRVRSGSIDSVAKHPILGEVHSPAIPCNAGGLLGGTFCVESRDGDLWIYFERDLDSKYDSLPIAKKVFDGILNAIGFTHGCHPLPFYYEHNRDHVIVER